MREFSFPGKGGGRANVTVDAICGGLGAAAGAHARSAGFLRPFSWSRRLFGESFSPEGGIFLPFEGQAGDHRCTTAKGGTKP